MKKILLGFSFLLTFCAFAYAQPSNDDCGMPENITDLDNVPCQLVNYNMTGATFDLVNGDCAASSTTSPNMWFSFTAQGPTVDVMVNAQSNDVHVALVQFDPNPCEFTSASQIACGVGSFGETIIDNALVVAGNTYYLIVNLSDGAGVDVESVFQLCISNELPGDTPANDLACDGTIITPNSGCVAGTTADATQEYTSIPGCSIVPENGVFYEFTVSPGNLAVEIDLINIDLPGDVVVMLGQWDTNCNGNFGILGDVHCGPPSSSVIEFAGVVAGQTYQIFVGTDQANQGDFEICVFEMGPPPGCSVNNTCGEAENIAGMSSSITTFTCVDGCNTLASPEPNLMGCNFATQEVVWYTFQSDANASFLTIDLNSTDIEAPSVQIFSGSCGTLNVQGPCVTGAGGNASIVNNAIPSNSTIYVAVSNSFGEGGEFELCLLMLNDPSSCVLESEIEITATSLGSPAGGPYQPNETVSFCYRILSYDATNANTNCQWLQGIIPIFGDGWSDVSFNGAGMPVSSTPFANIQVYGGNWGWYNDVTYNTTLSAPSSKSVGDFDGDGDIEMCHFTEPDCPNTGILAGDIMPPGWYAWSPNGGADGHPNTDFGDGQGCNVQTTPWEICFDLTTLSFPECDAEDPQITDTSIKFYTTSDGETGGWMPSVNICAQDAPLVANSVLNCCIGPELDDLMDVVCPGGTTDITLTSNQMGNITFQWTVNNNSNVSGYADGTGQFITQSLDNNSNSSQIVEYVVIAISEEGCFGIPTIVPVTVLPAIETEAGEPIDGCAQGEFELGGSPTASGGDNDFTYDWGNASIDNVANPIASPNLSTTYTVTVTDGNGCTSTDDVELTINPRFDVDIAGDTLLCPDSPVTTLAGSPLGGTPNYGFEWSGDGSQGSTNQNLDFEGFGLPSGTYVLTLTVTDDNGCTGDQEVGVEIFVDPGIFIIPTPQSGKFCPGGSIAVNAAAVPAQPGVNYAYNWTTPSGATQNGASIVADETGWYVLNLVDQTIFCEKTDSIFIEEIQPPEPLATSPGGVCENDMVTITLDTLYSTYIWSTGEETESILVEPGTYSVTVTNEADCEGETTITVNPFPEVIAGIGGSSAFCEGSSTTLSVSSEFSSFEWLDESGGVISTADTAFVVTEGMVTVMVIDSNGCPASASIDIVIQDFLVPNVLGDTSLCPQSCSDLNAGDGYSSYLWSTGDETQIINVCDPGDYSVTVSDPGGCTGEQVKTITVNDLPTPEIIGEDGELSFCPGGDLNLDAGSGYIAYLWEDGSENQTINVTTPGTYFVTVTDAESCQGIAEIEILENVPPSPSFTGDLVFCPGGSVMITPDDGFTMYEIDLDNNGSIDLVSDSNDPFEINVVGNSNIIVTDAQGCTGEVLVSVSEFVAPTPFTAIDTASYCTNGNVILSITEDFDDVEWYLDGDLQGSGQTIEVSAEGTYTVIVSDENGCEGNTSMVVIESTQLFPFIIGDNQICDNEPTILDAGAGYEQYDWGALGNTQTISVSDDGIYEVMVFDAGGCSGTAEFVVTNSETPLAVIPQESFICNNNDGENNALVDLAGLVVGSNGFWEDTDLTGVDLSDPTMVDFTGVAPGFYDFNYSTSIAIDPCMDQTYTMSVEVSECLCPSVTLNTQEPVCLGSASFNLDDLKVTGEDGFWTIEQGGGNPLSGNVFDPSMAVSGEYVINFNLENPVDNCDEFSSLIIMVIAPPNAGLSGAPQILCVGNDDVVSLETLLTGEDNVGVWTEVSGTSSTGSAFNDVNGTFTITDQGVGEYIFMYTVPGTDPCPAQSANVSVIVGANPIADASLDGADMLNCDLVEIQVLGTNSSGNDIDYSWTESKGGVVNNPTGQNITVNAEGTYVLEVTDQFQCVDVDSVIITRNTDFPSLAIEGNDPFCNNEQTGSVVANGSGGEGPYEYSLDNGGTWLEQNAFMNLGAGTYTVLVQDQNACTSEESITIEDPDEFVVGLGGDLLLVNVEDTLISLDVIGGAGNIEAAIWTVDGSVVCEGVECDSYLIDLSADRLVCVVATNEFGCVDSTCINVRSVRINDAYLGNSFTPNDDGENDIFYIQGGEDIEKVNFFRIFNRWGELVFSEEDFEPNNPEFGWKGRFKEKSVNGGVYAYTTEVLFKNGDIETFNGDVTVVK